MSRPASNVKYTTIKVADVVYERLNKCRVPRPDIGLRTYESTISVVLMDALELYEKANLKER